MPPPLPPALLLSQDVPVTDTALETPHVVGRKRSMDGLCSDSAKRWGLSCGGSTVPSSGPCCGASTVRSSDPRSGGPSVPCRGEPSRGPSVPC
eukprot:363866-Chlamydomonas_euryale.AAC.5